MLAFHAKGPRFNPGLGILFICVLPQVKKGLYSYVWENFCVGSIFVPSLHHMIIEKESFKIYITQKEMYGKGSLENKITQKGIGPEEGLRHEYEGPVS